MFYVADYINGVCNWIFSLRLTYTDSENSFFVINVFGIETLQNTHWLIV